MKKESDNLIIFVPKWLPLVKGLNPVDLLVYGTINGFNANVTKCFMSDKGIAERCACHVKTVKRSLKKLASSKYGLIEVKNEEIEDQFTRTLTPITMTQKRLDKLTKGQNVQDGENVEGGQIVPNGQIVQIDGQIVQEDGTKCPPEWTNCPSKIKSNINNKSKDKSIRSQRGSNRVKDGFYRLAEKHLSSNPDDYRDDPRWELADRRPMKVFPSIWFEVDELAQALRIYSSHGGTGDTFERACQLFVSMQRDKYTVGEDGSKLPPYKYITTFILEELLSTENESTKLANNQARGVALQ
jgi:hypothetical protein